MNKQPSINYPVQPKMSIARAAEFLNISIQGVHKQLKNKEIHCQKIGNKLYITHEIAKILFNIHFKQKTIVVHIVKGGTGKTTSILNIASCANTYGAKVLMIDADPQGNLTDGNGIDADQFPALIDLIKGDAKIEDSVVKVFEGIDLIPSRIENVILDNVIINERLPLHTLYNDLLEPVINNYDFIFVDCPPTMGQAVTAANLFADTILVPLNPDKFSAKGLKILHQEIETLRKKFKKNISYKVFLNKYRHKTILSDKATEELKSLLSNSVGTALDTAVTYSQEIPNLTDINRNLFSTLKESTVRNEFDSLTRELLGIFPENTIREKNQQKETETIYG